MYPNQSPAATVFVKRDMDVQRYMHQYLSIHARGETKAPQPPRNNVDDVVIVQPSPHSLLLSSFRQLRVLIAHSI